MSMSIMVTVTDCSGLLHVCSLLLSTLLVCYDKIYELTWFIPRYKISLSIYLKVNPDVCMIK